jgi:AmmeMemoRadiSam system protein A
VTDAPPVLTPLHRAALLAIARRAIRERVRGAQDVSPVTDDPVLQVPAAAFVTITRNGELRGCIGYVDPIKPLAEAVAHSAASAATADPRFPPVALDELPHLRVEISVLSPLRLIADPTEIEVGTHGIFISQAGRHGLLLPQVATEFGWDRETFLRQACLKAGLPADAWKRGADIQVFTVDHFTDDLPLHAPDS